MTEWNSDMDAAPKDGTPILVWLGHENAVAIVKWHIPPRPTTHDYAYPWQQWPYGDAYRTDIPTHWQPLPLPPETAS